MKDYIPLYKITGFGDLTVSAFSVDQPLDDTYNFPTKQHKKFHQWEIERVNSTIQKLEAQFGE